MGWYRCDSLVFTSKFTTVQLKDMQLAGITYDTSVIDPNKSKSTQFHHEYVLSHVCTKMAHTIGTRVVVVVSSCTP